MNLEVEIKNKRMVGSEEVVVKAGQYFRIETSPDGEEIFSQTCPAGKKWTVKVAVTIDEGEAEPEE